MVYNHSRMPRSNAQLLKTFIVNTDLNGPIIFEFVRRTKEI